MKLTSPAFEHKGVIPQKYGQDFDDVNPPLTCAEVPEETRSLVLVVDDPDIPKSAGVPVWDHWVVFNVPPQTVQIPECWEGEGVRGVGTRGKLGYSGPKPPDREHRYFFRLYAIDRLLDLPEGATKQQVLSAMRGHVLAEAELMGRFAPQKNI